MGHLHYQPGGEPCGCGARGCIEQYASTLFLRREAIARGIAGVADQEPSETAASSPRPLAPATAAAKASSRRWGVPRNGGGRSPERPRRGPRALRRGLASAYDLFGPRFEAVARARVFPAIGRRLAFSVSALGPDAGAIGRGARSSTTDRAGITTVTDT
ncbi:MAG: ROK family protein [Planctomycetota bacterium]